MIDSFSRIRLQLSAAVLALGAVLAVPATALADSSEEFKPQNEFKLDPWINIHVFGIDMSINKAVFMVLLAGALTFFTIWFVSRKMSDPETRDKPGKIQAAVEIFYDVARNTVTDRNIHTKSVAERWFPFLATMFLFIWFCNALGFIPMPLNTEHTVEIFGVNFPTFALYAATANITIPLTLALIVWIGVQVEGVKAKGPIGYVKGWVPGDTPKILLPLIFPVEALAKFLQLVSLTARLFANMLAGHMIILIMGGGMVVLLGVSMLAAPLLFAATAPLAVFIYFLDVMLVTTLQAFIFATLSAIYIGDAVSDHH
ncbi:MAG: F0F1 ATP synthase subunit A [Solirubrobacterales bacterium]